MFNSGDKEITEIALEMEEFRNELSIADDGGNYLPFLTKEKILKETPINENIKTKLINNEIFLAFIPLRPSFSSIAPKSYKVIFLRYWEHDDQGKDDIIIKKFEENKILRKLSVFRTSHFVLPIRFYGEETASLSFSFGEGIRHKRGLMMIPIDETSKIVDKKIMDSFHYVPLRNSISLGISGEKRKDYNLKSLEFYYEIVPTQDIRYFLNGITLFTFLFPFLVLYLYLQLKSLSLFGITSTTDFLAIISLGVTKFQTGLISIKTHLIISLVLIGFVYLFVLFY